MTDDGGTIARLIGEVVKLLAPLTRLNKTTAASFFAELGVPITEAQAPQLAPTLLGTSGSTGATLNLSIDLQTAVNAGQVDEIIKNAAAAGVQIANVRNGFNAVGSAVAALKISGVGPIVAELPQRITYLLLTEYLGRTTGLNQTLEFLGILKRTDHNVGSLDPAKPFYTENTFAFDRIAGWTRNPTSQLADLYDWGKPAFDGSQILAIIDHIGGSAGLPVFYDTAAVPPMVDIIAVTFSPTTDGTRGLRLQLPDGLAAQHLENHNSRGDLALTIDKALPAGTTITFVGNQATITGPDHAGIAASVTATYRTTRSATDPLTLLAIPGGSRISVENITGSLTAAAGATGALQFTLGAQLRRGSVVITMSEADGFLKAIIGDLTLRSNFDLGVSYGITSGLRFTGSSALEIQLPTHVRLAAVEVTALTFTVGIDGTTVATTLAGDLTAKLGPLTAVVQRVGTTLPVSLRPDGSGTFGLVDVRPGFKYPEGVGLSVDAGVISGGGFLRFDQQRQEYSGALELTFANFLSLKAIGIITTGPEGFSLLVVITAEFGAGLQLGFGFTLLAVGGLFGLNRTMNLTALADGIRSGAIESVMFPRDIIVNAPRIISDLRVFFPPRQDTFLIGPMAKLGWGTPTLISLAVGIIIEIPGNIAIVGVLKLNLPSEDAAVVRLQVNFIGALEFDRQRGWFFASLYDSRVLFITINGEMGVLMAMGNDANVVVAVGGFHPRYTPPPLPFPEPRRISVDILNTSVARIRAQGYFAATSNTVQFGSEAESYFGFSALSVSGHIAFDALITLSPFYFVVNFSSSFSVKVFGLGVWGLRIRLEVEGPTPWRARGSAGISLLFGDIDVNIDVGWGEKRDTSLPPIKVLPALEAELTKPENWRAVPPPQGKLLVSLRALPPANDQVALHPLGTLQITQKFAPLDAKLDRIGAQKPQDGNRFTLAAASPTFAKRGDVDGLFAPALFEDLTDADRLSRKGFEPRHSGVEMSAAGAQLESGAAIVRIARYDLITIDTAARRNRFRFFRVASAMFGHLIKGGAAALSVLSKHRELARIPVSDGVVVKPEGFAVTRVDTNRPFSAASAVFASEGAARDWLANTTGANPSLAGALQVVPGFEVAR